jgi:hypothetical protein
MVSATQQSSRIRRRKSTTNGKWGKRARRRFGTPAFAVQPEGYDQSAPDAKKALERWRITRPHRNATGSA